MGRLVCALAVIAIGLSAAIIVTTCVTLPPMVASHFAAGGAVSGYLPLDDYRALMLMLCVLPPAVILFSMTVGPRVFPGSINVPNVRAWLAPPYRDETLDALATRGALLAIVATLFIAGVHLLIVRANALSPPRLDAGALGLTVGAFVLAIVIWVVALLARFRRPPGRR
ncbi:MAG: hypothetical protein ABI190_12095 [Casimicrobiaceae bacterium]